MTAAQLASELEVSQRTVFRDIEALNSAGFPVYAIRGSAGGFELLAGFTSDLPAAPPVRPDQQPGAASQRVRLRLSPLGRRIAVLTGRPAGLQIRRRPRTRAERDSWVEAWITVESEDAALRDILALGPEAEVIFPLHLRSLIRAAALTIARLNDEPSR